MERQQRYVFLSLASSLISILLAALAVFPFARASLAESGRNPVEFDRDIRPIFTKNCFACHGPDEAQRKAGLRLDDGKAAFQPLKSGDAALVPGDKNASVLHRRITATDPADRMPPPESGKALTPDEIERIGRWIEQGAEWKRHWAFEPLRRPTPPDTRDAAWPRNEIDRFILAKLEERNLTPSPEADRRTLIRRLTFDLHGLPPAPEEIDAFQTDESPDAYDRLVDRLLASPRYGERWGRHWLDVAHYADTHGYDKDKRRPNAWPYRDYVIETLNRDIPYGRFVEEQIAGDVMFPHDPRGVVATGFIAAGPWDYVGHVELREGTTDKKITRLLDRDDMVSTVMATFTSMTVHCARCHDHKFDPITQRDYYGLQAVFAGVDRAERAYDRDPEVHRRRVSLRKERERLSARLEALTARATETKSEARDAIDGAIAAAEARLKDLNRRGEKSPSNGYHSAIESRADAGKWVQIDLGESLPIDEVVLVPARPTDFPDTPGFGFPVRYAVTASDDETFREFATLADYSIADFPNPGDERVAIGAENRPFRFVRVTASKLWERTSDYVFALAELQVWSGGKNVAIDARVTALDSIEAGRWSTRGLVDNYDSRKRMASDSADKDAIDREIADLESKLREIRARRDALLDDLLGPDEGAERRRIRDRLQAIAEESAALPEPLLVYAAATDFRADNEFRPARGPRPVHVLRRGDVNQPGEEAIPCALACVDTMDASLAVGDANDEGERRAALARWVTDPRNPLTWRSIVNRVWHYHFGRGIVDTPNDFGRMGSAPTHPELLDWLATAFLEHGQSLKWLHKTVVTSATYRQTSVNRETSEAIDGSNQYLWRMNRRQLDAESLRDAVLMVSGKLDFTMGGPGYDMFGFVDDHSPHYLYDQVNVDDPRTFRRTVYRFVVRSVPDPLMECLDCADPSQQVPVRNATITALQALAILNNPFLVRQAEYFAERLQAEAETLEEQIRAAYRIALGRGPSPDEAGPLARHAAQHGLASACRLILNTNEFMYVD